jgi:hypothetical protein
MSIEVVVGRVENHGSVDLQKGLTQRVRLLDIADLHRSDTGLGGDEGSSEGRIIGRKRSAATSISMSAYPFTRRKPFTASKTPAATHRSII